MIKKAILAAGISLLCLAPVYAEEPATLTDRIDRVDEVIYGSAQEDFRNKAASDTSMINQATENAEKILKRWAESVGKTCGDDFTVQFEYID